MEDSDSFIDQNKGVGDTVSQEEIGRALAGVGASGTKDSFSEEWEEDDYDEIDEEILKADVKYPLNREGYGASITFTLMETKTFADINGENTSFSAMSSAFKGARSAANEAREAGKKSRESFKKYKESESSLAGGALQGAIGLYKKESEDLKNKSESKKKEAVALSRQGSELLVKSITETGKNAERTTAPRDEVGKIQLYLPISFQQNDSFSIAGTELGILGAGILAGTSNTGSLMSGIGQGISSGFGSIVDLAANNMSGLQAATVMSRLARKLPEEVGSAFNIAAGVTVNPNLRSTFKGVNLREYTFQFKFLPKSNSEAMQVEEIIRRFRMFSYPEVISLGGVAAGYRFPDLFKIDVRVQMGEGGDTRVGNRIKDCYLRSVSTNYNPTSMTFHTDGKPVEIDLSLSFVEETTLSRKDIKDGY